MPRKGKPAFHRNSIRLILLNVDKVNFTEPIRELTQKYYDMGAREKKDIVFFTVPTQFIIRTNGKVEGIKKSNLAKYLHKWEMEAKINYKVFNNLLNENQREEFKTEVNKILKINMLGNEWFETIRNMIVSSYFRAPALNFNIVGNKKEKRLILEFNADTTFEDLHAAWNFVKEEQVEVFGKIKRTYSLSIKNLRVFLLRSVIKEGLKVDHPGIQNFIDSFDSSSKITDQDIAGVIFPGTSNMDISKKADKRRADLVRHTHSRVLKRFKNKTNPPG